MMKMSISHVYRMVTSPAPDTLCFPTTRTPIATIVSVGGTSVDIEIITGMELVFVENQSSGAPQTPGHQYVVLRCGDRLTFTNTKTTAIFYTIEPTIKRIS
jgi:hypothetical protein